MLTDYHNAILNLLRERPRTKASLIKETGYRGGAMDTYLRYLAHSLKWIAYEGDVWKLTDSYRRRLDRERMKGLKYGQGG